MKLELYILAQALEDVLRYELGLPLIGVEEDRREDVYEDALVYIYKYPSLRQRLKKQKLSKIKWLREIYHARQESVC